MPELPGYYTTKEAAERLGYKGTDALRQYCAQGKIPGAKSIGRMWFIPESWVENMVREMGTTGEYRRITRSSKK